MRNGKISKSFLGGSTQFSFEPIVLPTSASFEIFARFEIFWLFRMVKVLHFLLISKLSIFKRYLNKKFLALKLNLYNFFLLYDSLCFNVCEVESSKNEKNCEFSLRELLVNAR